jgi:SAM-dependent methyltransferase
MILNNNMSRLALNSCPLCHGEDVKKKLDVVDFSISKETFEIKECNTCGFVFTANPPKEASIAPFYDSDVYISHSDNKRGLVNSIYHSVREYMFSRKFKLVEKFSHHKSILDIGSGTGYFLNFMKTNGYKTQGIEINDTARENSKTKFGLQVDSPEVLLNGGIKEKFGAISLWHVLEHLYNPDAYMEAIKDRLEDDGTLIIAVPNHESFDETAFEQHWAGYDVPRHLWHFSPATLEKFAKKNGFKLIGTKMLPFDSFYVAILSGQYRNDMFHMIKGMLIGSVSYINGLLNSKKASSVIYILKKA